MNASAIKDLYYKAKISLLLANHNEVIFSVIIITILLFYKAINRTDHIFLWFHPAEKETWYYKNTKRACKLQAKVVVSLKFSVLPSIISPESIGDSGFFR